VAAAEPDFAAEGLLKGLRGKQREARLELLCQLHEAGVSLEELKKAATEDRLALLPVEMVLAREGKYSAREIAEATGQDEDAMRRQRQALGLPWVADPDAKVFTEDDLEAARRARAFAEAGFPEEATLEVSRVIGEAMSRVAAAIRNLVGERLLRPGDTERDVGLRYAELARETAPLLGPVLEYVLNQHLVEQIRDDVISRAELQAGEILPDARDMAVCFADLSGFTRLGEAAAVEEVGAVAGRLAALASEAAGGPVRLVKTIGDAAMLVSPEPAALVEAALARRRSRGRGRGLPAAPRGHGARARRVARGRLVRPHGQPRQPDRGGGLSEQRALRGRRARGRARGVPVVGRRRASPQGGEAAGAAVARATVGAEGRGRRYLNRKISATLACPEGGRRVIHSR
jgi:adenylate cyclase